MHNVPKKLWAELYFAVLFIIPTFFVAFGIGAANPDCRACWAGFVPTFWFMGVSAHGPIVWVTNTLSFSRRLAIWLTAMTVGVITSIGLGTIWIILLRLILSGDVPSVVSLTGRLGLSGVVSLAALINSAPVMVAWVVSRLLVRRSSKRRQVSSGSVFTPRITEDLEMETTVRRKDVQITEQDQSTAIRPEAASARRADVPYEDLGTFARATGGVSDVQQPHPSATETRKRCFHTITESDARFMRDGEIAELDADGRVGARATEILAQKGVQIVRRAPKQDGVAAAPSASARRTSVLDQFKVLRLLDWRLVPFYVAAILVSIAALRYILRE